MARVESEFFERLKQKNQTKIETLADKSSALSQTHFEKALGHATLTEEEATHLTAILCENALSDSNIAKDLLELKKITSEIKAINAQGIILHGERIKKAQTLLKNYREGAFTEWLIATYGNRQTPYNFLQYYEFYKSLEEALRKKMLEMPKQAIYTLAAREGPFSQKESFIQSYKGETKEVLLQKIRLAFPLKASDKRRQTFSDTLSSTLLKVAHSLESPPSPLSKIEKASLLSLLKKIEKLLSA